MFERILQQILEILIDEELLELEKEVDLGELCKELRLSMASAEVGTQFGPWLGKALLASNLVRELYADDEQLAEMLRRI